MKIFLAGHKGLLGSALLRQLKKKKLKILTLDRKKIDLENKQTLEKWFKRNKPDYVINAAAKAGGIEIMIISVNYMLDNIKIQTNLIELSHKYKK